MSQEDLGGYISLLLKQYRQPYNNLAQIILSHHGPGTGLDYTDGETQLHLSLEALETSSAKLAGYLSERGVGRQDKVGVLLPKTPELLISALAIWRLGAIYVPLFTAFGYDAISYRVADCTADYVITDVANCSKLEIDRDYRILVVGDSNPAGTESFAQALEAPPYQGFQPLAPDELIVLIYTSGTTGTAKGVPVPIWALAALQSYMTLGIGLTDTDKYWNLADPGWAYGLYYGLIAPMSLGHGVLFVNQSFDPSKVEEIWRRYKITNFAAAPTAYRAMRVAIGDRVVDSHLTTMSSAGEPLNPEVISWALANLGVEIRDHYGQTELGMMINNHNDPRLRNNLIPGSMGVTAPGFRAVLLDDQARELGPGVDGEVAIDTWSSELFWFPGYFNASQKTAGRFTGDGRYYLTGDVASKDESGNFFFSGRSDDVILSAGYRVGPFEVESTILSHPKVAECAVIGVPDELRGEAIWAYVVLRAGETSDQDLTSEIQEIVRSRLSKTSYPRKVIVIDELPKTPSGKIQRFLLRKGAS